MYRAGFELAGYQGVLRAYYEALLLDGSKKTGRVSRK